MTGSGCLLMLVTYCAGATSLLAVEPTPEAAMGRAYRVGSWQVQESKQFQICVQSGERHAVEVARFCERALTEIRAAWFEDGEPSGWRPRCQVIIHPNKTSYLAAVGSGGGSTVGSALVERQSGQIVSRRIDLCATTVGGALSALPHELTHVVLSDRFASADPPLWADEGLAVLADPHAKQARHASQLKGAMRERSLFRLPELISEGSGACSTRPDVFYAQSTSLVNFLVARGTRGQFVDFLANAADIGYDAALRKVYAIENIAALERLWHHEITRVESRPDVHSLVEDEADVKAGDRRS